MVVKLKRGICLGPLGLLSHSIIIYYTVGH